MASSQPCSEIVAPRDVTVGYGYINHEYPWLKSVLWTCEGHIRFLSNYGDSDWHGQFQEFDDNTIILQFDYRGQKDKLKPCWVRKLTADTWVGMDYAGRPVTMVKLQTFRYDRHGT